MAGLPTPHPIFTPQSFLPPSLFSYIFITLFLFFSSNNANANTCSSLSFDTRATVIQVYDGDTVKLASGEKIRLIGINTPEMHYDTGSPEPYARKAKRFLEKLTLNKKIGVKYGRERKDRYKRSLAHLYLLNGTNLQYELLKAGLAFDVYFPPNLQRLNCYKSAALTAKNAKKAIWKSPFFKPIDANKIRKNRLGFQRITGTIKEIIPTKKTIWIKMAKNMSLRISKKDLRYFKKYKYSGFKSLVGKTIEASGWISLYKKRYSMRIKHSAALKINP